MADGFECPGCGSGKFYEHRFEITVGKQTTGVKRYSCGSCGQIYTHDGRPKRHLFDDLRIVIGENI